jgi:hypothetical protein
VFGRSGATRGLRWTGGLLEAADFRVLALVLGLKLLLLAFGAAAFQVLSNQELVRVDELFRIWNRWDAPHYLFLAEHGYQSVGEQRWLLAFLPLFPWLVRALAPLSGSYLAAAFVLATFCSLVLAVLFRRLVAMDAGDLAETAVWYLFVFPTAYFLHIGYTEGLFLALTVGSFLAARRGRWWLAGLLGGLAGLTRINAVVLLPALATEAWSAYRRERRWRAGWLWIGLVLVGLAGYLWLNQVVGGHPLRFIDYQRDHWAREVAWPWIGLEGSWRSLTWRAPAEAHMVGAEEILFVLLGLGATLMSWFRARRSYAVWMTGNWLMFVCQPFIFAVPRFSLALFPMFLLFAQLARRRVVAALLTAWSLLFLALFASQFVRGHWAF